MNPSENKLFKSRRIISVVLFAALFILPVTGVLIDVAERTVNEFLLHFATVFHGFTGIVFTVSGIFHVVNNWKSMKRYLKNPSEK